MSLRSCLNGVAWFVVALSLSGCIAASKTVHVDEAAAKRCEAAVEHAEQAAARAEQAAARAEAAARGK